MVQLASLGDGIMRRKTAFYMSRFTATDVATTVRGPLFGPTRQVGRCSQPAARYRKHTARTRAAVIVAGVLSKVTDGGKFHQMICKIVQVGEENITFPQTPIFLPPQKVKKTVHFQEKNPVCAGVVFCLSLKKFSF